jgi:ATP-dependent DNA helicase RecG
MSTPRENERLEFKEGRTTYDPSKAMRYCVALANEGGGKFVLGVTDKPPRQVVGTQAFRNAAEFQRQILDKLGFRVDIEELTHPSGRIVVFHIPSRPSGTAYHHDGAYFMRSGEALVAMSEDQLRKIFNEDKPDFLVGTALDNVTADDVVRLLDTQSYFDLINYPYPPDRAGVLSRFESEKLIVNHDGLYGITNLGAVLFAKNLPDFPTVWRKAPRVVVYDGFGKLFTKIDQIGVKGYAVGFENLIDFIAGQTKKNEVVGKALRTDVKMFTDIAIRELIANALIHQDFEETGSSVMVEVYDDRLEISNPGKPTIPPTRFIDEYKSRNEKLADLMRRLRICEEKGSGIDKVVNSAEVFQLKAPDFRVGEVRTTVVLFAHQEFDDMEAEDRIRACYQHCCLRYVMNQKMTNQSLRERFKLPQEKAESASRIIQATLAKNLIKLDDTSNTSKSYAKYIPFWA